MRLHEIQYQGMKKLISTIMAITMAAGMATAQVPQPSMTLKLYPEGQNLLIRMAMMSGPPARPSLTGTGIPGSIIGIMPKITSRTIPRKYGSRFGSLSFFIELPSTP